MLILQQVVPVGHAKFPGQMVALAFSFSRAIARYITSDRIGKFCMNVMFAAGGITGLLFQISDEMNI